MRIGDGVSIPSQRRWVRYVDLWANQLGKRYQCEQVEVRKIEFWGMRIEVEGGDKIETGIAGFVDGAAVGSKQVDKIHVFGDAEVVLPPCPWGTPRFAISTRILLVVRSGF
jgi:protein-tyrosine phosphatase